ncbi:MAG: FtsX-like permease family protein, partial [Gammaproteobacteria bacterium]|nr:FtsX-like permease family protein [Gammaproteobacteria bacterium]
MLALLLPYSWQELRHHPWRNFAAVLAVMLGVALAFSVQLINASALAEFSGAIRSINGQPDLELRATQGNFSQALFGNVAARPEVEMASPVLEIQSAARSGGPAVALRVIGVDALALPSLAPALMPKPSADSPRFSVFAPGVIFLNAAARLALGERPSRIELRVGSQWRDVTASGSVAAGGTPIAVMDIGAAQDLFGRDGQLTRIDLRLAPGTDRTAFIRSLEQSPDWPADVRIAEPGDAAERVSNLSRAYRVNLTVLALVALFTGAYLVFSVLALSVAKRAQQFALLGVLGLTPGERLRLVLAESLVLGFVGSVVGIAAGTGLAWLALRVLGGDLGGGYFDGVAPTLRWSSASALVYGALGVM